MSLKIRLKYYLSNHTTITGYAGGFLLALALLIFYIFSLNNLFTLTTVNDFYQILTDPYTLHILKFTCWQALLSTLISLFVGVITAKAFHSGKFHGKALILQFFALTFVLPSLVVILGLIGIYGKQGWLYQILTYCGWELEFSVYGLSGILLAHLFYNIPFSTKIIYQNLQSIPGIQYKLAQQLNIRGWQLFSLLEWHYLKPQLIALSGLIFMLCFTSFAIILTLGGGPKYSSLEVAIYQALTYEFDISKAGILAVIQMLLCFLFFSCSRLLLSKYQQPLLATTNNWYMPLAWPIKIINYGIILIVSFFVISPLLYIIQQGLFNPALLEVLYDSELHKALIFSIGISVCAGSITIALCISLLFSICNLEYFKHKTLAACLLNIGYLPLTVPAFVMAVSLFITLQSISTNNYILFLIVALCNALSALPFGLNILYLPVQQSLFRYHRLNRALGIKNLNRWKLIDWPLIKKPCQHAFAFCAAISLGDFSVIALFGSQSFTSLPRLLYQQISAYNFNAAAITAFILLCLCILFFLSIGHQNDKTK